MERWGNIRVLHRSSSPAEGKSHDRDNRYDIQVRLLILSSPCWYQGINIGSWHSRHQRRSSLDCEVYPDRGTVLEASVLEASLVVGIARHFETVSNIGEIVSFPGGLSLKPHWTGLLASPCSSALTKQTSFPWARNQLKELQKTDTSPQAHTSPQAPHLPQPHLIWGVRDDIW